ncbi:MAG: hypothetical protein QOJ60_2518 [Actinomycetota bacterium]|nr:hypothetical protein [Actinomycetota bacterium]
MSRVTVQQPVSAPGQVAAATTGSTTAALDFSPTSRLRRLALVATLAVVAAVLTARGELAVVAVAPLVLLVLYPRRDLPLSVDISFRLETTRCIEDDELAVEVEVRAAGIHRVEAELVAPEHAVVRLEDHSRDGDVVRAGWVLVPGRWGRYRAGPLRLRLVGAMGTYAARVDVELPELVVYPGAGAVARAVAPAQLQAPLGEHASRATGTGVEFAGVRPYAQGDRERDVDWRTTARHQQLYVRQYAAERAFDLVVVLDTGVDAGPPGRSTLDLSVRAAMGLAQTYLRAHDRVGLVTLGGSLRWIGPASAGRQLYRICEAVMAARDDISVVGGRIERVPTSVLPSGAFVAVVTPLLDDRALEMVTDLRARGFSPLVIDVLTTDPDVPADSAAAQLALRVWHLHREALKVQLAGLGVPVLHWDGEGDLTGVLLHSMRALRPRARA